MSEVADMSSTIDPTVSQQTINEQTLTGHDPHEAHEHAHVEHKPDSYYIIVALILAAITALETSTYWVDFGPLFMPALLTMMVIKFVMVVSLFMHLKFDNKLFSYLFYAGLLLAIFVYVVALATFRFFGST
jgi:cytochrome c oxidase subunit 4